MAPMKVTHRPRMFALVCGNDVAQHGHVIEYVICFVNLLINIGFLVGSYLFLSSSDDQLRTGDILFIVASVATVIVAVYHVVESCTSREFKTGIFQTPTHVRNEFYETLMFLFAGLIFMIGSFFYWPGIYGDDDEKEFTGESWGAWLFIIGSVLYVIAAMLNAISLGIEAGDHKEEGMKRIIHTFHFIGLSCSQIGSVLFVAGSMFYRPSTANDCTDFDARYTNSSEADLHPTTIETCESTAVYGTWLYILGSWLYTTEALCTLAATILKHVHLDEGFAEDGDDDEDGKMTELLEQS